MSKSIKNIFTVLGGGVLSQIIVFGLSPVISRLYGAEDFGVFGSIISIIAILSSFATLKMDIPNI